METHRIMSPRADPAAGLAGTGTRARFLGRWYPLWGRACCPPSICKRGEKGWSPLSKWLLMMLSCVTLQCEKRNCSLLHLDDWPLPLGRLGAAAAASSAAAPSSLLAFFVADLPPLFDRRLGRGDPLFVAQLHHAAR